MADNQYAFPTEVLSLPSKGLLYPKDSPLSSGTIEVKYMTAREEDILTSQNLIEKGIEEGAQLVSGGKGKPDGFKKGYYVKPTIFGNVSNNMIIAKEEIFGPVLSIIPYDDIEHAVSIANDTVYGLAAYVTGEDQKKCLEVARELRAGQISLNYGSSGPSAPFGGYKQSGNGREKAEWGLDEFLEIKAIMGS